MKQLILFTFAACCIQSAVFASNDAFPVINSVITQPYNGAQLISANAIIANNKVILNWVISGNKSASRFIIEKSRDGKHYSVAAIVFSSENTDEAAYQFFEKADKINYRYRIIIVDYEENAFYTPAIITERK